MLHRDCFSKLVFKGSLSIFIVTTIDWTDTLLVWFLTFICEKELSIFIEKTSDSEDKTEKKNFYRAYRDSILKEVIAFEHHHFFSRL